VLLNRHLRQRLGDAARAHAARFTWSGTVAGFAEVVDGAAAPGTLPAGAVPAGAGEEPAAGRASA
jgi:hypothetical protein